MKHGTVNISDLGTGCWSPYKVLTSCIGCDKYDKCTLPDRQHDTTFDELVSDSKEKRRAYLEAQQRVKLYAGECP